MGGMAQAEIDAYNADAESLRTQLNVLSKGRFKWGVGCDDEMAPEPYLLTCQGLLTEHGGTDQWSVTLCVHRELLGQFMAPGVSLAAAYTYGLARMKLASDMEKAAA